jgi:hypothetical protein
VSEQPEILISQMDAVARVGQSLFGSAWIGALSAREASLLRRYTHLCDPPSLFGRYQKTEVWETLRLSPALASEVAYARDRFSEMNEQYVRAHRWLSSSGFPIEDDAYDREAFEKTLATEPSAPPVALAPNTPRSGDQRANAPPVAEPTADPTLARTRSPTRDHTNQQYQMHVAALRKKENRPPTVVEDLAWAKRRGITRERIRKLRKSNRSADEKRGGRPKRGQ